MSWGGGNPSPERVELSACCLRGLSLSGILTSPFAEQLVLVKRRMASSCADQAEGFSNLSETQKPCRSQQGCCKCPSVPHDSLSCGMPTHTVSLEMARGVPASAVCVTSEVHPAVNTSLEPRCQLQSFSDQARHWQNHWAVVTGMLGVKVWLPLYPCSVKLTSRFCS